MPAFKGMTYEDSFGKKVDKRNDRVAFNDATHEYWDLKTGSKYISVTQLISKYEQPFDEEFWSRYKAAEALLDPEDWSGLKPILLKTKKWSDEYLEIYGLDMDSFMAKVDEIKAEYKAKRDEACEHGTLVHAGKENSFYENADTVAKKYGFEGHFQCIPGYYQLDLERGIYPEFLISYDFDGLRVSGQVDLLVVNGNEISIGDWKGLPLDTVIPTEKGYTTMEDLNVGDKVFDKDGNLCNVIVKSNIHHNPCYKIYFDAKAICKHADSIVADKDHR